MQQNLEEREWLSRHFEQLAFGYQQQQPGFSFSEDARRQIAELLIKSQTWDNFMAIRFASVKRYGGEGAESLLAFYWQLLRSAAQGMCAVKIINFFRASVFRLTQIFFNLSVYTLLTSLFTIS